METSHKQETPPAWMMQAPAGRPPWADDYMPAPVRRKVSPAKAKQKLDARIAKALDQYHADLRRA